MSWSIRTSRTPIGIDVGARQIKAAQLRRSSRGWSLEAAACLPRPNPNPQIDPEELRRLCDVLYRQGLSGKDVVLAVPGEKLLTGLLELPPRDSGAPVEKIARMELARMHKCEPESFEMYCWDVPTAAHSKEPTQVMAAACTHADADALLDLFEMSGLNVRALDLPTYSLARACEPALAGKGTTAVVDLGWQAARLVVLYRGVVTYERELGDAGVRSLAATLDSWLELESDTLDHLLAEVNLQPNGQDEHERRTALEDIRGTVSAHFGALAQELQTPFSYMAREYTDGAVVQVLLVGGGASIPGLAEHMSSAMGIECRTVAAGDLAECPPRLSGTPTSPTMTMAIGLAKFFEQ